MLNRRDLIAASAAVPIFGMPPAVFAAPAMAPATSGATIMMREIENLDAASGGAATLPPKSPTKIAQLFAERERLAEIEKTAAEAADKAWAAWHRVARTIPDEIVIDTSFKIGTSAAAWDMRLIIDRRRPGARSAVSFDIGGTFVTYYYFKSSALRAEIADPATMMDGVTVNAKHLEACKAMLPRVEAFEAKCERAERRIRMRELEAERDEAWNRLEDCEEAILGERATSFEDFRMQCDLALRRVERHKPEEQLEDMIRWLAQSGKALSERARLAA